MGIRILFLYTYIHVEVLLEVIQQSAVGPRN